MHPQICLVPGSQPQVSIRDWVGAAAEAGFRFLALQAAQLETYLAARPLPVLDDLLRDYQVYLGGIYISLPQDVGEAYEALLFRSRFMECCTCLDALGGGVMVLSLAEGVSVARDLIAQTLADLVQIAAPFDVRVALTCSSGGSTVALGVAEGQELVRQAAPRNGGLALDADSLTGDVAQVAEWVRWVHLGDVSSFANQDGPTREHLVEFVRALAQSGFAGPYGVAPAPDIGPVSEAVRAARQIVLDLLVPFYD